MDTGTPTLPGYFWLVKLPGYPVKPRVQSRGMGGLRDCWLLHVQRKMVILRLYHIVSLAGTIAPHPRKLTQWPHCLETGRCSNRSRQFDIKGCDLTNFQLEVPTSRRHKLSQTGADSYFGIPCCAKAFDKVCRQFWAGCCRRRCYPRWKDLRWPMPKIKVHATADNELPRQSWEDLRGKQSLLTLCTSLKTMFVPTLKRTFIGPVGAKHTLGF